MNADDDKKIYEFEEKPENPKSNLASMGVYIFNWRTLKQYFLRGRKTKECFDDFGKDVIPAMLKDNQEMYAYPFKGYWRDVGTIQSLWEANGCSLLGTIDNTVLSHKVDVGEGSIIRNSVIMPNVTIGKNVVIEKAMIAEGAVIKDNAVIKSDTNEISVVSEYEVVNAKEKVEA